MKWLIALYLCVHQHTVLCRNQIPFQLPGHIKAQNNDNNELLALFSCFPPAGSRSFQVGLIAPRAMDHGFTVETTGVTCQYFRPPSR